MEFIYAAIALIAGLAIGYFIKKSGVSEEIKQTKEDAKRIIDDTKRKADDLKKEAAIEAKKEALEIKRAADDDVKERMKEVKSYERRLLSKEETLEKKVDAVENRERALSKKEEEIKEKENRVESVLEEQKKKLEQVAGMTREQAKELVVKEAEQDARQRAALIIRQVENEAKEESEKRSRRIISTAIQRCASDHVAEATISVVTLPSDDMKGRIIGREGRNIRMFENLTGINLIIDDTPEAVILSSFDPIRREIARLTLDKLIADGRIQPARIEEMYEKSKTEVDKQVREIGEQAMFEVGIHGLPNELIKVIGQLHFHTSYGQNVLKHSVEVAHLTTIMANEIGIDPKIAKRAGLLHDIGKAIDHEIEGPHAIIGAELARKQKESKDVVHAIEAHHGEVEPNSIEAILVMAGDAISAARPGARRETLESYIRRLEKLETIANSFNGVDSTYALQAGREIRVMVKSDVVDDSQCSMLSHEIAKQIEEELEYPGQIKVTVIRETRMVDYAK